MTDYPDDIDRQRISAGIKISAKLALAIIGAGVIMALLGLLLLYGFLHWFKRPPAFADEAQCPGALASIQGLDPLIHGEIAALDLKVGPRNFKDLSFLDAKGQRQTIGNFKSHIILLNLWAYWCEPCRNEMPALDQVQMHEGDKDFEVIALDIDLSRPEKSQQFLEQVGATHLKRFGDPNAALYKSLHQSGLIEGIPASFLIDKNGCALGLLAGKANWNSPEARALIKTAKAMP